MISSADIESVKAAQKDLLLASTCVTDLAALVQKYNFDQNSQGLFISYDKNDKRSADDYSAITMMAKNLLKGLKPYAAKYPQQFKDMQASDVEKFRCFPIPEFLFGTDLYTRLTRVNKALLKSVKDLDVKLCSLLLVAPSKTELALGADKALADPRTARLVDTTTTESSVVAEKQAAVTATLVAREAAVQSTASAAVAKEEGTLASALLADEKKRQASSVTLIEGDTQTSSYAQAAAVASAYATPTATVITDAERRSALSSASRTGVPGNASDQDAGRRVAATAAQTDPYTMLEIASAPLNYAAMFMNWGASLVKRATSGDVPYCNASQNTSSTFSKEWKDARADRLKKNAELTGSATAGESSATVADGVFSSSPDWQNLLADTKRVLGVADIPSAVTAYLEKKVAKLEEAMKYAYNKDGAVRIRGDLMKINRAVTAVIANPRASYKTITPSSFAQEFGIN